MSTYPDPNDLELLGLSPGPTPDTCRFELVASVARHDGGLYGGTAIAASVVAMESATEQGTLWATTQYISTTRMGAIIECTTEVVARGRNISQVHVAGRTEGRLLFFTLGATAVPREGGLEGQYLSMPRVPSPDGCPPMEFGLGSWGDFKGFTEQVDYRSAMGQEPEEGGPALLMWCRLSDDRPATAAAIAFMADMVPGGIARSAGMVGGGTSLDNSLRFGGISEDDRWVLLEIRGQMSVGSHAHGSVNVWSVDGRLLAVGGQSANMVRMVDPVLWEQSRSTTPTDAS